MKSKIPALPLSTAWLLIQFRLAKTYPLYIVRILHLFRPGNINCRRVQKFHELAEGREVDALVVSVDSSLVFSAHGRADSVGLHALRAQFRGIGSSHLHDGVGLNSGEHLLLRPFQRLESIRIQARRRRRWTGKVRLRILD